MDEFKNFFSKFFEILGREDKEELTKRFLNEVYLDSIDQLLNSLPKERQAVITQTLQSAKTPELLQRAIETYFDKAQFEKIYEQKMELLFSDYLKTIEPDLTDLQKQNIKTLFQNFQPA